MAKKAIRRLYFLKTLQARQITTDYRRNVMAPFGLFDNFGQYEKIFAMPHTNVSL